MVATWEYIDKYGKPVAFYRDKHSVFRVSQQEKCNTAVTQYGRALHDLGIELFCANSPQAKERVERADKTLQDRLITQQNMRIFFKKSAGVMIREHGEPWFDGIFPDPSCKTFTVKIVAINNTGH